MSVVTQGYKEGQCIHQGFGTRIQDKTLCQLANLPNGPQYLYMKETKNVLYANLPTCLMDHNIYI